MVINTSWSSTALQKATQRTAGKGLALLGAGVTVTADAAVTASSLVLNMKTSNWEAQGQLKGGRKRRKACARCAQRSGAELMFFCVSMAWSCQAANSLPVTLSPSLLQCFRWCIKTTPNSAKDQKHHISERVQAKVT